MRKALFAEAPREDVFERTAILTLVVVFLHASGQDAVSQGAFLLLSAAVAGAIAWKRLHRRAAFWLAAAALLGAELAAAWFSTDDHIFLLGYWLLAMGLALLQPAPAAAAATSARWLLGLVFLFATIWKLVSPVYVSGEMFHYLLLVDPRLGRVAVWAGMLPADVLRANFDAAATLGGAGALSVTLRDAPGVSTLAAALTWLTVALEGTLAAVFLHPRTAPWVRDALFFVFLIGTYLMAPVVLFGLLLCAMGLSFGNARFTNAYLVAALWIFAMAAFFLGTL